MSSAPTAEILTKEALKTRTEQAKAKWIQREVQDAIGFVKELTTSTLHEYIPGGITINKYISKQQYAYRDALYAELKTCFPDSTVYVDMKPCWWRSPCCTSRAIDRFFDCVGVYTHTMCIQIVWT